MTNAVGLVGLGEVGSAIATRLITRGHDVVGFDPDRQRAEAAGALGVRLVDNPAAVAESADGPVVLIVGTTPHAHTACFGHGGLAGTTGDRPVVVMSSLSPRFVEDMSGRIGRVIDAPFGGGAPAIVDGRATIMAACSPEALDAVRPLLDQLATTIEHVGTQPGQGQKAKLITQIALSVNLVATVEALRIASALGLDEDAVVRSICASSGRSFVAEQWEFLRGYMGAHHVENIHKDLRTILVEATAADVTTPLATAALHALRTSWLS